MKKNILIISCVFVLYLSSYLKAESLYGLKTKRPPAEAGGFYYE